MRLAAAPLLLPACVASLPESTSAVRARWPECHHTAERQDRDGDGAWEWEKLSWWEDDQLIEQELRGANGEPVRGWSTEWEGPRRRAHEVEWSGPQRREVEERRWSWRLGGGGAWIYEAETWRYGRLIGRAWGTVSADLRQTTSVLDQDADGVADSWDTVQLDVRGNETRYAFGEVGRPFQQYHVFALDALGEVTGEWIFTDGGSAPTEWEYEVRAEGGETLEFSGRSDSAEEVCRRDLDGREACDRGDGFPERLSWRSVEEDGTEAVSRDHDADGQIDVVSYRAWLGDRLYREWSEAPDGELLDMREVEWECPG